MFLHGIGQYLAVVASMESHSLACEVTTHLVAPPCIRLEIVLDELYLASAEFVYKCRLPLLHIVLLFLNSCNKIMTFIKVPVTNSKLQ